MSMERVNAALEQSRRMRGVATASASRHHEGLSHTASVPTMPLMSLAGMGTGTDKHTDTHTDTDTEMEMDCAAMDSMESRSHSRHSPHSSSGSGSPTRTHSSLGFRSHGSSPSGTAMNMHVGEASTMLLQHDDDDDSDVAMSLEDELKDAALGHHGTDAEPRPFINMIHMGDDTDGAAVNAV